MKTFIFLFISLIFFTSCSSHSVATYLNKDEFYTNSLQYTKKADIVTKNEIEIIFTASYLNKYNKKFDNDYENFVISIYNNSSTNKSSNNFGLYLDDKKVLETKILSIDDNLVKNSSLKNSWANYYLVKFEKSNKERLSLRLKFDDSKEAQIDFQKSY